MMLPVSEDTVCFRGHCLVPMTLPPPVDIVCSFGYCLDTTCFREQRLFPSILPLLEDTSCSRGHHLFSRTLPVFEDFFLICLLQRTLSVTKETTYSRAEHRLFQRTPSISNDTCYKGRRLFYRICSRRHNLFPRTLPASENTVCFRRRNPFSRTLRLSEDTACFRGHYLFTRTQLTYSQGRYLFQRTLPVPEDIAYF